MLIITFIIIFNYEKKSSYKKSILSDSQKCVQAKNYSQVKLICYLREIIRFTTTMTLETGASLGFPEYKVLNVPCHEKTNKMSRVMENQQRDYALPKNTKKPRHHLSLIRFFAVRVRKTWVLKYL